MKIKNNLPQLLLAAALTLGLAGAAMADDSRPAAAAPAPGSTGLLGETYAGLTYSYVNLHTSPVNADNVSFEYNEPLTAGFDSVFTYDWTQAGLSLGDRANQQTLSAALRAFGTGHAWGKPFIEAGLGYTWTRVAHVHDNSVYLEGTIGTELQVAPAITVTPFVRYADAPDLAGNGNGTWSYGVKANWWVERQWSITAGISHDDNQDTRYTIGTNFRF